MKIAPRAVLLTLLLVPIVRAQTTLTVNSQTSATNGLTVQVEQGTSIVVTIDDASQPRASYGLFGALMDNGMNTGWFLRNQGAIDPFPLVTGIATSLLEAQLAYENGEITAEDLAVRERDILARLRELHPETSGAVLTSDDLDSVDVVADLGDQSE